jgi:hypothetical protein
LAAWAVILLYNRFSKRFTAAWSSQNAEARAVWARYILEKGDYILGVQTLRNALTSASLFATARFTTLSLIVSTSLRSSLSRLSVIKYGTTSALLVGAALSYLQSVRTHPTRNPASSPLPSLNTVWMSASQCLSTRAPRPPLGRCAI